MTRGEASVGIIRELCELQCNHVISNQFLVERLQKKEIEFEPVVGHTMSRYMPH